MLKCNVRDGGMIFVKSNGTAEKLMSETAVVIQLVYRGIRAKNPALAQAYKNHLLGLLLDPESPVWKE